MKTLLKIYKKYFKLKILLYIKALSTCKKVIGMPKINQPCLFLGLGTIKFADNVNLGYFPSPFFYNGIIHLEARNNDSLIEIGSKTYINNNSVVIAKSGIIKIGKNCLIGTNCEILNSDFHNINPKKRFSHSDEIISKDINIEDNVFIGNNVKILKGVTIGKNSVIANGSIITRDVPKNRVWGGNPAIEIKKL